MNKYENYTFDDAYGEIYDDNGIRITNYYSTGITKSDTRNQAEQKLAEWEESCHA